MFGPDIVYFKTISQVIVVYNYDWDQLAKVVLRRERHVAKQKDCRTQ